MRKNNVIARRAKPDEAIQVVCRLQGGQIAAWIASHSLAMTEIFLTFSHMNRPWVWRGTLSSRGLTAGSIFQKRSSPQILFLKDYMRVIMVSFLLMAAHPALSAVHFSILGSANINNLGLSNQDSRSASASVAVDVGQYLRLGVTHRQGFIKMEGYRYNEFVNKYSYIEEKTHSVANSLDLTIVLYYGEIFVPYVQIGFVKKEYRITSFLEDQDESVTNFVSMHPVPNGGVGVGVRLDQNFSLKLSYTVSPGVRQLHPDLEPETGVLDTYTSVGLSYQI